MTYQENRFKIISLGVLFFLQFSCSNNVKQKKIGEFLVESEFINDTIPNGVSKFYKYNKLDAIINFDNGIKNGKSLHFHSNGKMYDSVNFTLGLENGYQNVYDDLGDLRYQCFYLNGHKLGPETYYVNGVPSEYFFNSFERINLYHTEYDTGGRIVKAEGKLLNLVTFLGKVNNVNGYGIFSYTISPPSYDIKYELILKDSVTRLEKIIRTFSRSEVFIDTVLTIPISASKYYLKATEFDDRKKPVQVNYNELIYY